MNAEQAAFVLAHVWAPRRVEERWKRTFTDKHHRELKRLGLTDAQVERLERILPAIVYYTAKGPRLADARKPLVKLATDAHKAAAALRVVLEGRDDATQESRGGLLHAIEALHPDRCEVDPARVSSFHPYDHREPEAQRMLAALQDLKAVAEHAVARMPKAQTRAVAHVWPIKLIDAALTAADGPAVPVSASIASTFREVATLCYDAAGHGEPLRAIRAYLRNASPEK